MAGEYVVQVFEFDSREVIKEIKCGSERLAERVEMGLLHQMNREDFGTRIVSPKD
jgi:hypothetical protein